MGRAGDHQLPAHLLEVFLLGAHGEGGGVLQEPRTVLGTVAGTRDAGVLCPPSPTPQSVPTLSRTRVGREAPAVP